MSQLSFENSVKLPSTPSYVISNLSCAGSEPNTLCYIHHGNVQLANIRSGSEISAQRNLDVPRRSQIYQVAALFGSEGEALLGVASDQGFQLWSGQGTHMLWFVNIDSCIEKSKSLLERNRQNSSNSKVGEVNTHFIRGLASSPQCHREKGHIYFGTSCGTVFVHNVSGSEVTLLSGAEAEGGGPDITTTVCPITALASNDEHLVSADEKGCITAYSIQESYKQVSQVLTSRFSSDDCGGHYVSSLACCGVTSVAAFTTGHIRLYRMDIGDMILEIAAHSRCITALAVHPTHSVFASCGEDQTVNVWSLESSAALAKPVELVSNFTLTNSICVGIAWLAHDRLAVTAYDDQNCSILRFASASSLKERLPRVAVTVDAKSEITVRDSSDYK